MELAPEENVQVGTFLNEIASVAGFIAKMMSDNENMKKNLDEATIDNENMKTKIEEVTIDNENMKTKIEEVTIDNENMKTKIEEVTIDNENIKTKIEDLTTQNKVLNKQVVDLTGENQKLFQEKEEEIFKRKDTEEELKFLISKNKEQKGRLVEFRARELQNLDEIEEQLGINEGLKNKGREIVMKAKQKIKRVSKENALLTIENELFNKFEEKRTKDGKCILEDLARLKKMTTQFSFCRKRVSKRELFNRIDHHIKESMSGCIE